MELRPYQKQAIDAVLNSFWKNDRVLVLLPTGVGKTFMASKIVADWPKLAPEYGRTSRVLWLAHQYELLWQAGAAISLATGQDPLYEVGDMTTDGQHSLLESHVVVASCQTMWKENRRSLYRPDSFGLIVFDEVHHSVSQQNVAILEYFSRAKICGLTATCDRSDEISLGTVFQDCAFEYSLPQAIKDGWCCPLKQQYIEVEGLDWSQVRKQGSGDMNPEDVERVICQESVLHKIVAPAVKLAGDRQTIIFCPTIKLAEAVAALIPRYSSKPAVSLSGKTAISTRDSEVQAYLRGETQWLVVCALFLEGFDAPRTSCIVVARPTASRMRYAQMVGRALRGGYNFPIEGKPPEALVIDLVGASLKHKLVHSVDILGGNYEDIVVERANQLCRAKAAQGDAADPMKELLEAAAVIDELRRAQRLRVIAEAKIKKRQVDPFTLMDMPNRQLPGWWASKLPTEAMSMALQKAGIKAAHLDYSEAKRLLEELDRRRWKGECTFKQARILTSYGYDPHISAEEASKVIDQIAARGWRHTKGEAISRRRWQKKQAEKAAVEPAEDESSF